MIMIADPSKPFEFTPKGTPRRGKILADYEEEIEAIYSALENMSEVEPPSDWSPENSLQFVTAVVEGILKHGLKPSEDMFEHGCDR